MAKREREDIEWNEPEKRCLRRRPDPICDRLGKGVPASESGGVYRATVATSIHRYG